MLTRADLHPYQTRFVDFAKAKPYCAGWIDMGLGKTVSTLTAYADMLASFDARRVLVVGPLRVARKVWTDELKTWSHLDGLTASRIIGDTPAKRWAAANVPADIHTINRENLAWLVSQFVQDKKQIRRWPWDLVVLDESQSFREQGSGRWKAARIIRRLGQRMVQLTGTPAPKGYGNLWAQMYLLDLGHRLGATETAYRDRWFEAERTEEHYTKWHLKPGADVAIQNAVKDLVLTLREEDYLTLPPVQYNAIMVDLPPEVQRKYEEFERDTLVEWAGKKMRAASAGAMAGKLLQFANGAVYYDDKGSWQHIHDAKLDALLEVLEALDKPALIVYGFKHDLARLRSALALTAKKRTVDVLDSEASEERWKRGETDYLILHPASAGHGLNLQRPEGEEIIWFGLTPDWELYTQANARLAGGHRRAGKNVRIHHILASGTRDERMLSLLRKKENEEDGLMRALSSPL